MTLKFLRGRTPIACVGLVSNAGSRLGTRILFSFILLILDYFLFLIK